MEVLERRGTSRLLERVKSRLAKTSLEGGRERSKRWASLAETGWRS